MPYPRINDIFLEMSKEGIHTFYDYEGGVTTLTFTKMTEDGKRVGATLNLEPDLPEEIIHLYLENVKRELANAILVQEKKTWNPSFRSRRR
jgi:hypothetical protein